MGFSWIRFTAITFSLASLLAQSFEDLIVLRHPPTENRSKRNLTCFSEDDGAALIWNHNIQAVGHKHDIGFQPHTPTPKRISECAIWDSALCVTNWKNTSGWDAVNSTIRPMGPVFDYRWEGFKEFVFEKYLQHEGYRYVGKVSESSGTAVFSVRGNLNVHIFLCENRNPTKGRCFWIILAGLDGQQSVIRSCVHGVPEAKRPLSQKNNCSDIADIKLESNVIDAFEWRTFRITWIADKKVIQVFRDLVKVPFLQGEANQWGPVSDLSMRCGKAARVRFHFYEYFATDKKNLEISTKMNSYPENLCIQLLVGLCVDCKLKIILVDKNGRLIATKIINGDENFSENGLLSWRSIIMNENLPKTMSLQLKIETILNDNKVKGQWAVGNFRKCHSFRQIRESTIKIRPENALENSNERIWPKVNCQKLSYSKSEIVYSNSKNRIYQNKNGSDQLVEKWVRGRDSTYVSLSKRSSLCNSTGCTCDRGYHGIDCSKVLPTVNNLEIYEADPDANVISLRWSSPDPANDDIEYYHVSVMQGEISSNWVFKVSDHELSCELWKNYVCLKNLTLLPDAEINTEVELQVYAKIANAEEPGRESSLIFVPESYYNKAPSRPLNLTVTHQSHGVVMIKWSLPSITSIKITQFRIVLTVLSTYLVENLEPKVLLRHRKVVQKQNEYNMTLALQPSTCYVISVHSLNRRNIESMPIEMGYWVPGSVGFASEEAPQVQFDGIMIEIKIPAIVNATRSTTLEMNVKGLSTCTPNQSQNSTASVNLTRSVMEWKVAEYKASEKIPESLKISVDQKRGLTLNCFLHLRKTYTVVFLVTDWRSNSSAVLTTSPIILIKHHLTWLAVIPVFAICVLVIFICYRNRSRVPIKHPREPSYVDIIPISSTEINTQNDSGSVPQSARAENRSSAYIYSVPKDHDSCSVSVEYFEEYSKKAAASGLLYSQFMVLPSGLTRPSEYGRLPENMPKNRNSELIAYDETRVVLQEIPGVPYSDYINASYIKGYKTERAYIAAQGPKPNTVNDFWRMVWQEEVCVICMLTNVIEGTETKCEKYWPEFRTSSKYGHFIVSNANTQVFADYTIRTFKLSHQRGSRKVTHLHFTGWPSLGVPTYSQSLVAYLKKLERTPAGNGPILVHCSTGDDRTGVIILCDICLRQGVAEEEVDATAVITRMRESRANLVGTPQQFVLAHIVIMECLLSVPTQIPCTRVLLDRIKEIRRRLPSDVRRLDDSMWHDQALRSFEAPRYSNMEELANDTLPQLISGSRSWVMDSDFIENGSSRFSAVSVDGVRAKKQYLASWLPSYSTIPDFWKFVDQGNIELIIILQCSDPSDPTCCDILPIEPIAVSAPRMQVENRTSDEDEGEYFTNEKLVLTDNSEKKARTKSMTVLTCKGWGRGEDAQPPTPAALVSLWITSEKIVRKEGQTLVLCHNGVTGCGLYLALSFLLERMAVEGECDVISAVRAVRRSRPEFVQSLDQFEFLYDAAINYTECFQSYANFS